MATRGLKKRRYYTARERLSPTVQALTRDGFFDNKKSGLPQTFSAPQEGLTLSQVNPLWSSLLETAAGVYDGLQAHVESSRLVPNTSGPSLYVYKIPPASRNFSVTAKIYIVDQAVTDEVTLFGHLDALLGYHVGMRVTNNGDGTVWIRAISGDFSGSSGSTQNSAYTASTGTTLDVELRFIGSNLRTYVDGVMIGPERTLIGIDFNMPFAPAPAGFIIGGTTGLALTSIGMVPNGYEAICNETVTASHTQTVQSVQFVSVTETVSAADSPSATGGQIPLEPFTGTDGVTVQSTSAEITRLPKTSNDMLVYSNRATGQGSSLFSFYRRTTPPASADYTVTADVYCNNIPAGSSEWLSLLARADATADTAYYAEVTYNGSSFALELWRIVAGTAAQIGTQVTVSMSVGETHNLKFVVNGSNLQILWDDVVKISQTDSNITAAGYPGFSSERTGSGLSGIRFDNWGIPLTTTHSDSVTEAAAANHSQTVSLVTSSSITEAAAANHSQTVTTTFAASSAEAAAASHTQTVTGVFAASATESATATDVPQGGVLYLSAITEAASTDASQDRTLVVPASATEAVTVTDSSSISLVAAASVTESASATDEASALAILGASVTEAVAITEVQNGGLVVVADTTEAAGATEVQATTSSFVSSLTETVSVLDVQTSIFDVVAAIAEAASAQDVPDAIAGLGSDIAESVATGDAVDAIRIMNAVTAEAASAVSVESTQLDAVSSTTEAVSANEASTVSQVLLTSATEAASVTELQDAIKVPAGASEVLESVTPTDSNSATATQSAIVQEAVTAVDLTVAAVITASLATEAVSANEVTDAAVVTSVNTLESVSATVIQFASALAQASIAEAVVPSASHDASGLTQSAEIIELVAATDDSTATLYAVADVVETVSAADYTAVVLLIPPPPERMISVVGGERRLTLSDGERRVSVLPDKANRRIAV